MKFPGRSILDVRMFHKERHPVHAEPISLQIGWPPYFSFSFLIPFLIKGKQKQFWIYFGWEPELDGWDFTWFAIKITAGEVLTGRDNDNVRGGYR